MTERDRSGDVNAELTDAVERLGVDVQRLLDQRGAGAADVDPHLLNAVFREAHSIKGLAGLFGRAPLAELAHAAEDLLDGLRMGRVALGDEVEELLLALPDALAERLDVETPVGAEPSKANGNLEERILAALEEGSSARAARTESSHARAVPEELRSHLTTYEEHRLSENLALGHGLYAVRGALPLGTFDQALRELRPKVQALGEVIATLPVPEEMTAEVLSCDLLLASPQSAAQLAPQVGERLTLRMLMAPLQVATVATPRPQRSVRIDIRKLDRMMETLSELELVRLGLARVAARLGLARAPAMLVAEILQETRKLERRISAMQSAALEARMVPLTPLFLRTQRMVQRMAKDLGKEVVVELSGGDVQIDKVLAEALAEPLVHLTRNAVDHGIEAPELRAAAGKPRQGKVSLHASQRGGLVMLEVRDDGAGIDPERVKQAANARGLLPSDEGRSLSHRDLVRLLLTPGFSTAAGVSSVSGRGVGLDAVRAKIVSFAGFLEVDSKLGQGSSFLVGLPATLALLRAMMVRVKGQTYALPVSAIWEAIPLPADAIAAGELVYEGKSVRLVPLSELFGFEGERPRRPVAVIVGPPEERVGLVVDGLMGQRDLVSKPLNAVLGVIPGVTGLSYLGPGQPVLVLDVAALVDEALGRPALRRSA